MRHAPIGLCWDAKNYSCAYDTILTAFYYIWMLSPHNVSDFMKSTSFFTALVFSSIEQYTDHGMPFEGIREIIRPRLHALNPEKFPLGPVGCSLVDLTEAILDSNRSQWAVQAICNTC
ncbi:hypothetical protein AURDEDRAFT_76359, partial [Auricularia subglabra TFB-10046 SS5]